MTRDAWGYWLLLVVALATLGWAGSLIAGDVYDESTQAVERWWRR